MQRLSAVGIAACMGGLDGCGASYNVKLSLAPRAQEAVADEHERERIEAAVSDVAPRFGLTRRMDDAGVGQSIEEDRSVPFRVLDEFVRGKDKETSYTNIVVLVVQDKKSGRFEVRIRSLGSDEQTPFGKSLEQSLVEALKSRLPSYDIKVDGGFEPLVLGP